MFTATADFHHFRPFGVLAVFTAVLAVRFGRTITGSVRAFGRFGLSHRSDLLKVVGLAVIGRGSIAMLGPLLHTVKSASRVAKSVYFSNPDNQCMMLRAN
jgi:hypothetical protein